jgi:hypothetical protein
MNELNEYIRVKKVGILSQHYQSWTCQINHRSLNFELVGHWMIFGVSLLGLTLQMRAITILFRLLLWLRNNTRWWDESNHSFKQLLIYILLLFDRPIKDGGSIVVLPYSCDCSVKCFHNISDRFISPPTGLIWMQETYINGGAYAKFSLSISTHSSR